jgi:hypothetical protein
MSSYYGWRDIGTGGPRRTPEINAIIGNFTSNNDLVKTPDDIAKEYCSNCGCKLVYSTKIKKWICSEKGCNLTKEESDILLGKASLPLSSPSQQTTTPATAFEKQANSLLDGLEDGEGGGFIPMQRAGNTDVISRQEGGAGNGGGYTMTMPSSSSSTRNNRHHKKRYNDGLDGLREPSNDLPSNAISISSEVSLRTPDGKDVLGTYYPPQKLKERLREKQMDELYDTRYEGQPDGDPLDRSIHSSSGLKV